MSEIVKRCKVHGDLTIEQTRKDGEKLRCKQCRLESHKKSYEANREKRIAYSIDWKKKNRPHHNEWERNDRKMNPEKYKRYEDNYKKKHGLERMRKMEVARIHGLTIEQYDELQKNVNYLCQICGKPETRVGKDGSTVTPLCVDHCHFCEEKGHYIIRGILCHTCNSALGKFKESKDILKKAYEYVCAHEHIKTGDL